MFEGGGGVSGFKEQTKKGEKLEGGGRNYGFEKIYIRKLKQCWRERRKEIF